MARSELDFLSKLHRANQLANELFTDALPDGDFTLRQIQLLKAIGDNAGASQTVLCSRTGIDRSTLAGLIERLSKRRLIARKRNKSDARAYVVTLTEAGTNALDVGLPVLKEVEAKMLSSISAKQRAELLSLMEHIVAPSGRGS